MALLLGALLLAVVCLVIPKLIGGVPLTILSGSMAPTMPEGSLAVVRPVDGSTARVGDVLSYQVESGDSTLVTHRVIAVSRSSSGDVTLTLQGDANDAPDDPVDPEQVQAMVVYAVPYFGWVANRLNVGTGAGYVDWAAYALIAVGSLRVIRAFIEALRARSANDVGRHEWRRRLGTDPLSARSHPNCAGPLRGRSQRRVGPR